MSIITIQNHLFKCAEEDGVEINWNSFIPDDQEDAILQAIKDVGSERLKPIKDALPKHIDYMAIKAVLMKHEMN